MKNIKYAVRLSNLLIEGGRDKEVVDWLLKCVDFLETVAIRTEEIDRYVF